MAPRVSIALCTYNGARYLQEQLESIALQSRLPMELVVCDDQSTDNTISILKRFQAEPAKAQDVATKPLGALPKDADAAELAAWTMVGNVLLNLDEMLMKR